MTCEKTDQKVYVGREVRNAYSITPPGTKTMFTVLFCINAAGQYLPPFTVYKAKDVWDTWTYDGVEGASYGAIDNGWMTAKIFESWIIEIFNSDHTCWETSCPHI